MATFHEALTIAIQHHQSGRLPAAEQIYRQILATEPNHVDTLHLLGLTAHQAGKHEDAVKYITRAIELNGSQAAFHNNLGTAYQALGKLDEAVACYRRALALNPDYVKAHCNLGSIFQAQGRLDDAVPCYRRALDLKPDHAVAHNNLGSILKAQGRLNDAIACYGRALTLKPDYVQAHYNLGNAFLTQNRLGDAAACFSRAAELKPDYAEAHNNLGTSFEKQNRPDDAAACFRRAIELKPDLAEAHCNLGKVLMVQEKPEEAVPCFRLAFELKPDLVQAHSNFVFALNYCPDYDAKAVHEEHHHWNRQHGEPLAKSIQPHANERSAGRRLRIGYVSPDFHQHSVAYFIEPLLTNHNPQNVEVFCYAEVHAPDAVTERIRLLAHHWRSTCGLSDDQVAALIRADGIDVLVDLAGHTANNRLLVFARKPAPIQVTYLGYPNTTGLQTIDYRFTDATADPPGKTEDFQTEQLSRLPDAFLCYGPPSGSPSPAGLPALSRGNFTFGSFNTLAKINRRVSTLWSSLLAAVPNSRLLLKAHGLAHESVRRDIRERFVSQGLDADRLELRCHTPSLAEHLQCYREVDIALDTFPYNGTATTCEAFWMGVPVVTLAGNSHAARVGASLLSCIGLGDLIAETPEQFLNIAVGLASDLPRLSQLRVNLRDRMQASPLMDAPRFARNIEAAYRDIWQRWCAK